MKERDQLSSRPMRRRTRHVSGVKQRPPFRSRPRLVAGQTSFDFSQLQEEREETANEDLAAPDRTGISAETRLR